MSLAYKSYTFKDHKDELILDDFLEAEAEDCETECEDIERVVSGFPSESSSHRACIMSGFVQRMNGGIWRPFQSFPFTKIALKTMWDVCDREDLNESVQAFLLILSCLKEFPGETKTMIDSGVVTFIMSYVTEERNTTICNEVVQAMERLFRNAPEFVVVLVNEHDSIIMRLIDLVFGYERVCQTVMGGDAQIREFQARFVRSGLCLLNNVFLLMMIDDQNVLGLYYERLMTIHERFDSPDMLLHVVMCMSGLAVKNNSDVICTVMRHDNRYVRLLMGILDYDADDGNKDMFTQICYNVYPVIRRCISVDPSFYGDFFEAGLLDMIMRPMNRFGGLREGYKVTTNDAKKLIDLIISVLCYIDNGSIEEWHMELFHRCVVCGLKRFMQNDNLTRDLRTGIVLAFAALAPKAGSAVKRIIIFDLGMLSDMIDCVENAYDAVTAELLLRGVSFLVENDGDDIMEMVADSFRGYDPDELLINTEMLVADIPEAIEMINRVRSVARGDGA